MEINFINCDIDYTRAYNGANGSKIAVIYDGSTYMLKFPSHPTKVNTISYTNSCISEYVSCKIVKSLGIDVQDVIIGKYKEKVVVACKDFTYPNKRLYDFASIKNTIIDSKTGGKNTDLNEILDTIKNQKMIDPSKLETYFWNMFICDAILGNFDRHNGNWGLIYDPDTKIWDIAPMYDFGSCLFPQNSDEGMEFILNNTREFNNRTTNYPGSAITTNKGKINYHNFLMEYKNENLKKALVNIVSKIDEGKIKEIINSTPYISDTHKKFMMNIVFKRIERILLNALEHEKKLEKPKKELDELCL